MHQQSRHPPRVSSPALSPQTNPTRTNNPRDPPNAAPRSRSGSEATSHEGAAAATRDAPGARMAGPSRESIKKLDQIIQNFYYKAAMLIVQSRMSLLPAAVKKSEPRKTNKWFQIETEDVDEFREDLAVWKSATSFDNRPPPMIIETYVDASRLSTSQTLVLVDEDGKRYDVLDALNASESSADGGGDSPPPVRPQRRHAEVVLERWRIELRHTPMDDLDDFGPTLPTIYKRSIVFFRALYVATRILPCFKYSHQAMAKGVHPALEVRCRFRTAEPEYDGGPDPLRQPLCDGRAAVTDYMLGDLEVPVGRLYASVTYRNDCTFRVDDSESLLSSRFMGIDENYFKPSIPQRRGGGDRSRRRDSLTEFGSLASHRHAHALGAQEPQQTYGSLSTFHGQGALGTSPISALRAVRPIGSDTSSPPSVAASAEAEPPYSLPIRSQSSAARPSLRSIETTARRPSISFQPFKAGSLSGSPRIDAESPASPHSLHRGSVGGFAAARNNRSSLTAGMAASLRGGPPHAAAGGAGAGAGAGATPVDTPPVGSPKPTATGRYSSSFTHRRGRLSFGGQSKVGDDDQVSSGKQSLSSSAQQPGSGLLAEAAAVAAGGGAASSGSLQTDDENISEFLKMLDSKKVLPSFEPGQKGAGGESAAARRTAAQLSKFHLMRESHNVLTESMTSSMHLHPSSGSSSRQLANVPSMVHPTSASASSSPVKPLSPHTPYTPAIPSRLSENSIVDYHHHGGGGGRHGAATNLQIVEAEGGDDSVDDTTPLPVGQEGGTTAIDIPLSPRLLHTAGGGGENNRRASSVVAHQQRGAAALSLDDDPDNMLVQRSISLGADDREAPTLSTLLALQQRDAAAAGSARNSVGSAMQGFRAPVDDDPSSSSSPAAAAAAGDRREPRTTSTGLRVRYSGRGRPTLTTTATTTTTTPSSRARYVGGSTSTTATRTATGGSGGAGEEGADDEPLVFAMSELERDSRRSLEEARRPGSSSSAGQSTDRRGFEPRGTTRRGW